MRRRDTIPDTHASLQDIEGEADDAEGSQTQADLPAVSGPVSGVDLGARASADLLDPVVPSTHRGHRLKTDADLMLGEGVAQTERLLVSELAPDSLPSGFLIDGRYEVLSVLGRGGFGVVYKARQRATGQLVAVKVLLNRDADPTVVARFEREMAVIARLKHPNIVGLIDSGHMDGGQLFAVLEFIEGGSLAELIREKGPLGAGLTRRLMVQVLEALAYAHKQGIIHRDLKPQNIMVMGEGALAQARVLDFGLAALAKEARAEDYLSLTGTNQFQGTPGYMSPEQLTHGSMTARIDIYSLGLVFAECLVGRPIMQANSLAALIYLQLSKEPVRLPQPLLATPLGALIARMVLKVPEDRPASSEQVLEELAALDWQHPSLAAFDAWAREQDPDLPYDPNQTDEIGSGGWFRTTGKRAEAGTTVRGVMGGRWGWGTGVAVGAGLAAMGVSLWLLVWSGEPQGGAAVAHNASTTEPTGVGCEGGRVLLGPSQCCWPGQRWDAAHSRCDGTPARCPEGWRPHSTDCVPLGEGQQLTATLEVPASNPPNAKVFVNGVSMGSAPTLLEGLPLGDMSVMLSLPGHGDVWQFATLDYQNHTLRLTEPLSLKPQPQGVPEDMVAVPGGPFWRGCLEESETNCEPFELPGGWMSLDGFAIDRVEVSVGAYARCVEDGGCALPVSQYGPGSSQSLCFWGRQGVDMFPLNCVMWSEASAFCAWKGRRLPTAAEWEKAARGPSKQRFPWGEAPVSCELAIVADAAGEGCGRDQPWPVGSRPKGASAYGALDMIGNLEEWTSDEIPQDPGRPIQRMVKGGGFDDKLQKLRTSKIDDDVQTEVDNDLGFRCAISLSEAPQSP